MIKVGTRRSALALIQANEVGPKGVRHLAGSPNARNLKLLDISGTTVYDDQPRLDLLTHDHNVRAELLAAGLDIGEYRERGVALHGLTSFIGLENEALRVDVLAIPVRAGDRLLLCTDGVHRQLDDGQLRTMLALPNCRLAAERLVEHADEVGGRDNATALVVEVGVR